jgi:ABC-type multidrug transport system fused ATPase/permease subunit
MRPSSGRHHSGADSKPSRGGDWKVIRDLIPYLLEYKFRVTVALACLVAAKVTNLGIPILLKRLIDNWSDDISIKEIGLMETDAAYVIDKHNMSFCLRTSPSGGNLESLNLLTYVAIHEQAHVMSIEIGHGNEFNANFKYLLNYAKTLKYINPLTNQEEAMYVPIEPASNEADSNFCGVHISSNAVR